jgi:hypothetical protein
MSSNPASIRAAFALGVALVLCACNATDYSGPISTFATATTSADAALNKLNTEVTDEYKTYLSERARTDLGLAVKAADGECELGSTRCRLAIVDPDTPNSAEYYPPDPLLANMVAVMGEIRAYAQNLAALVADNSAAEAASHVNAALGSVQSLANTVDGEGVTKVPSFATPAGTGVNWLIGQYANYVKVHGLRTATREAKPVVERAAAIFETAAVFGSDLQREALTDAFQDKIDDYQDNREDSGRLNAAVGAAKMYDDFLVSKPGETFKKMGEAHTALADALQNPDLSLPQAISKIEDFAAQAEQLNKIVTDLAALRENE